ncbi:MAG: TRAP transporter small permease [Salinarimonadaceae bacterium]|nr:MAG: TRAP transporter small permease [Salinarimonadaceae bacterium]
MLRTFEKVFVEANKWALVLLFTAMAVIVFANVSLRYLTTGSIIWAEEVARYLMIWMTFIGAGLALRVGGHVAISNLQEVLPNLGQKILRSLLVLMLLGFFCAMIWFGLDYMNRTRFQLTPATRIPFRYVYAAMPIGFGLLIVHLLLIARTYIETLSFRELEADGTKAAPID